MMCRDLEYQRDPFFFYLAVISYASSMFKVKTGEDVDDSCPQNFFHRVSYICQALSSRQFADERLLASKLVISFFPIYRFGVTVKGNSIVRETYLSPRQ